MNALETWIDFDFFHKHLFAIKFGNGNAIPLNIHENSNADVTDAMI